MITVLAHHALARAELLRALSGIRSEAAVLAARRAHFDAHAVWLDIHRLDDLAVVEPSVVAAASLAGPAASEQDLGPDLHREAVRTLATVCPDLVARMQAADKPGKVITIVVAASPCPLQTPYSATKHTTDAQPDYSVATVACCRFR